MGLDQPGDGLVLCVDDREGPRRPPNVTITRVVAESSPPRVEPLRARAASSTPGWIRSRSRRGISRQRFATGRWNNATAHALLQLETIEKGTSRPGAVGYVVFPFFIDPETGEPPQSTGAKGYRLREGGYQCQVYAASEGAGSGFDLGEVVSRPKIPCASVLIRAPRRDARGSACTIKAVPQYEDGAYDGSSMYPTAVERGGSTRTGPIPVTRAGGDAGPGEAGHQRGRDDRARLGAMDARSAWRGRSCTDRPLNYRRSDVYAEVGSWASTWRSTARPG